MRLPWIAAAAAVVGAVAGLVDAALQSPPYRATVSFVVAPSLRSTEPGIPTLTRTAAALVRTPSVAQNVISALALHDSRDHLLGEIGVRTEPGTAVVRVTVSRDSKLDAQRVAQQVLVVFQGLANSRLGRPGQGSAVTVWDPASDSATRAGRPYGREGLGGAAVGLLVGVAAVLGLRRRGRRPLGAGARVPAPAPASGRRPVPAPKAQPAPAPQPAQAPASAPTPTAPRVPEPASAAVPEPAPAAAPAVGMLAELERRTAAEQDPARREELAFYLEQLRAFALPDGSLPLNLLGLAEEVFGAL